MMTNGFKTVKILGHWRKLCCNFLKKYWWSNWNSLTSAYCPPGRHTHNGPDISTPHTAAVWILTSRPLWQLSRGQMVWAARWWHQNSVELLPGGDLWGKFWFWMMTAKWLLIRVVLYDIVIYWIHHQASKGRLQQN